MLFGFAALLVGIVGAYVVVLWNWHRAYKRETQAWLEAGGTLRVENLLSEAVADDRNAALLYLEAADLMPATDDIPEDHASVMDDPGGATLEGLEAVELAYADVIDLVQIGSRLPDANWPVDYERLIEDQEWLPTTNMRPLVRLLDVRVALHARRGETNAAVETLLAGLRFADHIDDEPTLLSALVGAAVEQTMLRSLERHGDGLDLTKTHLTAIESALAARDAGAITKRALLGEGAFSFAMLDSAASSVGRVPGASVWVEFNQAEILRYARAYRDQVDTPFWTIDYAAIEAPSGTARLAHLLTPSFDSFHRAMVQNERYRRFAEIALGLREFKQEFGSYPEMIDAVIDPLTGAEIGYERLDEGFRLEAEPVRDGDAFAEWTWER